MNTEQYQKRARELVAQMTLEERVSQLTYHSPAVKRLNIPEYNWWNEALHGVARAGTATSFPQAIALAAMFDDGLLERIADVIAEEGRAKYNESVRQGDRDIYKGLTFWSPNVNIFRDPRWGRGHETYGEDPYLTSRLGVAFINGLQGHGEVMKTAACAKHFAVHSGPEDLRHEFNAEVTEKDLRETYLPAFEACVREAKAEAVMGAYNRTNGEPCCGSYRLLRDILRGEWQFDGHVVSDCWALKDFHMHHGVTVTAEESAALAMDAGCDLNCGNIYLYVWKAYQDGMITEEHITRAAERLFTTRFKLGMFDETEFDQIPYEKVECREHLELSVEAARKSMVLLKNNGILPLDKSRLKTIGVIGSNANSRLALKGNYYGTSSRYITLLEGIQDEAGESVRVLYAQGCELTEDRTEPLAGADDRLAEAVSVAEHSEVVILCLGLDETIEGEELDEGNNCGSGDKADLQLPAVQKKLLERVTAAGTPVILCLTAGSAMDVSYSDLKNDAVLLTWYPGAGGGRAAADILFGNVSPSGKLPVTFYRTLEGLPEFTDYSMRNRTYRYYQDEPLYSFGYGLTYGDVWCTSAELAGEVKREQDIRINAVLYNQGPADTDEVVQVYLKNHESRYAAANVSLCAFQRIHIGSGQTKNVELTVSAEALKIYDEQGRHEYDGKRFTIYVGTSLPDQRSMALTGHEPAAITIEL